MSDKSLIDKPVRRKTLAEQLADTIKDLITSKKLIPGEALPTEPEIAAQFGVSRAVVRDATRILMAWGLVEVQHGKGVYVSQSQNEAFGDALFLALQRNGASVWDIEEFEQLLFPGIVGLASVNATDEEREHIRALAEEHNTVYRQYIEQYWGSKEEPPEASQELLEFSRKFYTAIANATHNKLIQQLAHPLQQLRSLRSWQESEEETLETLVEWEASFINKVLNALQSRDADDARRQMQAMMVLPREAISVMKNTPVGETPLIPLNPREAAQRSK